MFDKQKTSSILRNRLAQLLQVHREIIDLIYFHGKTISDAGAIEGVKQNTVKTRMFFARKRVAGPLRAEGIATATA